MHTPLQITYRGLGPSAAIEAKIRERAAKLEHFHPSITSCRVVVGEEALHRQHTGRHYNVRIDLHVPGHEYAVTREHDEDVYVALRDAFDAAKRALEDDIRQLRRDVKSHEEPQHGRVIRLDWELGHGYIESTDGSEVYFSRENLTGVELEQLEVGSEVQFLLEPGKNRLLARRVSTGKHSFGG